MQKLLPNIAKFLLETAKENYVYRANITTAHGEDGRIGRKQGVF